MLEIFQIWIICDICEYFNAFFSLHQDFLACTFCFYIFMPFYWLWIRNLRVRWIRFFCVGYRHTHNPFDQYSLFGGSARIDAFQQLNNGNWVAHFCLDLTVMQFCCTSYSRHRLYCARAPIFRTLKRNRLTNITAEAISNLSSLRILWVLKNASVIRLGANVLRNFAWRLSLLLSSCPHSIIEIICSPVESIEYIQRFGR